VTSLLVVLKGELETFRQLDAKTPQNEGRVLESLPGIGGQSKAAQVFKTPETR